MRDGALLVAFLLIRSLAAGAQTPVPNDNLAARLLLTVGIPRESRTDGCTVEWGCVDEKLTGRLIDYHNDQWFSFRPPHAGQYYVNLGGQRCRETRGVQLVALTAGELCRPATYSILSATSLGTQDDVFVPLLIIDAEHEILLCVDGYLHDYCRFRISVDTVAQGIPAIAPPTFGTPSVVGSRVVALCWTLPDSLSAATGFRVRRRSANQPQATEVAVLPVHRNAAGGVERAYATTDTVPRPGQYAYQILTTQQTAPPALVHQRSVTFREEARRAAGVPLPLDRFRPGADLTITVTDALTGRVVRRTHAARPRRGPAPALAVAELAAQGVRRIRVSISGPADGQGRATAEFEAAL